MKNIKSIMKPAVLAGLVAGSPTAAQADDRVAVLENYANIAQAGYEDSLALANSLNGAIDALLATPNDANMEAARQAWRDARVPYMQTEVYRFGNVIVDDWEGKVNAWPLDEGLLDYVDTGSYGTESDENVFYAANLVANSTMDFSGQTIDASTITKTLLEEQLQEADGNEANVATGYHAVEFLLWGQDLNGNGPGAGNRPATDYDASNCTNGNCDRRAEVLKTATDLLVDDLTWMAAQWAEGGAARSALMADTTAGINTILTGMGSLSYGELAGERMKLGLILHDPEEEHDCFADNTHFSHYYDAKGIQNVFEGSYTRTSGEVVQGPGVRALLSGDSAGVADELGGKIEATMQAMQVLVDNAESGQAYDQMIGEGNEAGNQAVQAAIDALVDQTKSIDSAVNALGLDKIEFEGSDSLDAPEKVGA
ncbi:MAG: imelysin family protein [Pseudomonadota bacterium]